MKVFLTGASGLIGGALTRALAGRGHQVVCAFRRRPAATGACHAWVDGADFTADLRMEAWQQRLAGAEVVINAVGQFRETSRASFEAVHAQAPIALFTAAAVAGCRRVIQISALGADARAGSAYHLSKRTADEYLAGLPLDWVIVQPSLVYDVNGRSARLFTTLASLPVIPVPGRGDYQVQPIHLDDLVEAIVALVESPLVQRRRIALVGPVPLRFDDFLGQLRLALGMTRARFIHVPRAAMNLAARFAGVLPGSLLDRATLDMLFRGNTADAGATRELLQRPPRGAREFVPDSAASLLRQSARLGWLLPVLRWSIALVWIVSGVVSLAAFPVQDSLALLARAGVPATWGRTALYAASALDVLLGLATLLLRRASWLWLIQIGLVIAYTVIVTLRLPEFWAHPYGPVLKNLPMLAAIWLIYELEKR